MSPEAQAGERGLGRALAQGRIVAGPFDAGFAVSAGQHFWLDESKRRLVTSDQKLFGLRRSPERLLPLRARPRRESRIRNEFPECARVCREWVLKRIVPVSMSF
jgi:hypothetical protein